MKKYLFLLIGILFFLSSCNPQQDEQFLTGSGSGDNTNYQDFLHAYILNETITTGFFDYAGRRNLTTQGNPALASNVVVHSNYGKSLLFDGTGDWLNMTTPYIDSNNYTTVYMLRPVGNEDNFERFAGDNSALGEVQDSGNDLQMGGRSGLGNFYFNHTGVYAYNSSLNNTFYMITQIAQKAPTGNYLTRNFLNATEGHNATWNTYTMNAEDIFQVGGTPTSSVRAYFQVVIIYNGTLDSANMTALSNALWSGDLGFITGEVGESDSCSCVTGSAWTVVMSDYCVLNTGCAVPSLNFTGSGNFSLNARLNITTSATLNISSGQTMYINSNGVLDT